MKRLKMQPKLLTAMLVTTLAAALVTLLTACGGAGGNNTAENAPSGVTLSETFTASDGGVDLTLKYPQGWAVQGDGGQIMLANSQSVLDQVASTTIESVDLPDDGYGMQIQLLPAADMPTTSPEELLGMLAEGAGEEGVTLGTVEAVQINGQNGAKVSVTFPQDTGEMYIVQAGDYYLMVFAAASNYADFKATTEAVINSIEV